MILQEWENWSDLGGVGEVFMCMKMVVGENLGIDLLVNTAFFLIIFIFISFFFFTFNS